MRYRYYQLDDEGFIAKVCNPRWTDQQTRSWGERFILRGSSPRSDPQERADYIEYMKLCNDWEESLLEGTYLVLYDTEFDLGCVLFTLGCPLVLSPRAYEFFRSLSLEDEIEFEAYPAYSLDERSLGVYYCVRYLVYLECADEERSSPQDLTAYRLGREEVHLVLRRDLIGSHRVFVVDNYLWESKDPVVVRSDVVEAIE